MTDDDALRALHDHLAATAELPVRRDASHLLGEAEAVAADLADEPGEVDPAVVRERARHVRDLLARVEETGTDDPRADEHVEAAVRLVDRLLADETESGSGSAST
jgi:Fe-S-cluster formation regulator IscX/YfhJ